MSCFLVNWSLFGVETKICLAWFVEPNAEKPPFELDDCKRSHDPSQQVVGDLHVSAVLATDVIERMTDLPQRVVLHRLHQGLEDVGAGAGGGLEVGE